jgi:hypothetical protein
MENLKIYNKVKSVPKEAKKPITAGRLKGKTDINPMWRIKALTEQFGPCGFGWYFEITKQWLEPAGEQVAAFVNINLYVKQEQEWSLPIPGTGGNMFIAQEKGGLHVSDECYKMALTDAISVACKSLGMGADVYWSNDNTKYPTEEMATIEQQNKIKELVPDLDKMFAYLKINGFAELTKEDAADIIRKKERK